MPNELNLHKGQPVRHLTTKKPGGWEAYTVWDLPGDLQLEIYTWRSSTNRSLETRACVYRIEDGIRVQAFGRGGDYRHVIRKSFIVRLTEPILMDQHQSAIDDLFDAVVNDIAKHYNLKGQAA